MKSFIVLFALTALAFAASYPLSEEDQTTKAPIPIVRSESSQSDDGSYNFQYEGADGTVREETADIENKGTEDEVLRITGSYRYIDANGDEVLVTYTADENGFVPVGTIIPKEISDVAAAAKDLPSIYEKEEAELKKN